MNNKRKSIFLTSIIMFIYLQIFFDKFFISLIIAPILSIKFSSIISNVFINNDKKEKRIIFREFLDIFNTNIIAGNNLLFSLKNTYSELKNLFSEEAYLVRSLQEALIDIDNGESIDSSLYKFRRKSNLEEVSIFIDSLIIALNSGIDISKISENSKESLSRNISLELEIDTIVNNSKKEFLIMIILPLIVLVLLNNNINAEITFADYIVRIPVFILLLFSFILGEKIVNLEW